MMHFEYLLPVVGVRLLRWAVAALILIVSQGLTAQGALAQVKEAAPASTSCPEGTYGTMAEQMPSYRGGGTSDIFKAIQRNFRYSPTGTRKPAGTVYVQFEVDKEGKARNIKIAKGATEVLDAEAIRAIEMLERFQPAIQHGHSVPVSFTVPIKYINPQ